MTATSSNGRVESVVRDGSERQVSPLIRATRDDPRSPSTDDAAIRRISNASAPDNIVGNQPAIPSVRSLRELLEDPSLLEPPKALIPHIAYRGRVTLISGQDKAGKSTLLTQAAACLSAGLLFLDHQLQPTGKRALWIALDEDLGDFVRRAERFAASLAYLFLTNEAPHGRQLRRTSP
jgi:hypothetical protein